MSYTVQDFGPSDLLSSDREGERRVKTSAMRAEDVASINGKLHAFSVPYEMQIGASKSYNIDLPGDALLYEIIAKDLTISVNSEQSDGTSFDIHQSRSMNFKIQSDYIAFAQEILDFTLLGYSAVSGNGALYPSIYSDENNPFAVTLTNNTQEVKSGFLAIKFEAFGEYISPFGLTPTVQLLPTTEMSNYA